MKRINLNRPLKYKVLSELIRSAIIGGEFRPGCKLPSENELIDQYNVSRPTVREAVGALVSEGLVMRHQGKGMFVANPLPRSSVRTIAFVLCGKARTDPLFSRILSGAQVTAQETGYHLLFYSREGASLKVDLLKEVKLKGIIVTGLVERIILDRILAINSNVVLIGDMEGPERAPLIVTNIISNDYETAYTAVEYLIKLGHRCIAHITGTRSRCCWHEAYRAYQAALQDHHLPLSDTYVIECQDEGLDYGYQAMNQLLALPERPTALFAANDRFAWGAIRAIRERRLQIPDDMSVIGMGDLDLGDRADFLTTMKAYPEKTGAEAVHQLFNKNRPKFERITIAMEMVLRQSCQSFINK